MIISNPIGLPGQCREPASRDEAKGQGNGKDLGGGFK